MYCVEFEIKDATESNTSVTYLDLLVSIGREVNFTLPFMTNVTISISISQIFRTCIAVYQLRPPMASLFHNLYDMPGLAPRMDVCHTYIGFQRCTKIHINTDSLPVHPSVPPSLYRFFSQNCLHILSKVFRSTAKQPTPEVGSIRCGSSRIHRSY